MSVIARIAIDGEQSDLKHVLTGFNDDLTVTHETDSPSSGIQIVEVQTSEGEILSRFHQTCIENGLTLTIRRITHEPNR